MTVGRICMREVDLAEPYESVYVAAQRMHARKVGTLVVVDPQQQPVGIITDRDLTVRVLAQCLDPVETTVGDVMTRHPKTVSENEPIEQALAVMRSGPFRRVPVVDRRGALVGVLSLDDVLDLLSEEFSQIGQLLERESPVSLAAEV